MNELIAKLKESGKESAFNSPEEFSAAAKELGFSEEDISAAVGTVSFPLSDDELEAAAGGASFRPSVTAGPGKYQKEFDDSLYRNEKDELIAKVNRSRCPKCGQRLLYWSLQAGTRVVYDSEGLPLYYESYCQNPICYEKIIIEL